MKQETARQVDGLDIRRLIEKTYEVLAQRNKHKEVIFPENNQPDCEIADDSDWHRTRTGSMFYKSVELFQFSQKTWAIGIGTASGGYPARPYDSDLLALEFVVGEKSEDELNRELSEAIRCSTYFKNSLFFGRADGLLAVSGEGRFSEVMRQRLAPVAESYLARQPEYDTNYIELAWPPRYVNTRQTLYKNTFPEFLAKTIEDILANPPSAK